MYPDTCVGCVTAINNTGYASMGVVCVGLPRSCRVKKGVGYPIPYDGWYPNVRHQGCTWNVYERE